MKPKLAKKLLLVTCFLAIIVAGGTQALGFPTSNTECGDCHTNQSVLTLSSNATGTVDATVGVPFTLIFDGGNGVADLKIVSAWADNDQFLFSLTQVEDDGTGDDDSNPGEISAEISITPLAAGTFTIKVWVAAGEQLSASVEVSITVEENTDTTFTPPTSTTTTTTVDPEQERVELWTFLMYTLNPIVAVMLVIFGVVMCKRTQR
ncbi:MAG: hypothetical protein ACFFED_05265 [Candidatus Thorarchaeota archaeon]